MDTIVAGLSKSLTTMRSMKDCELHAAEKADVGGAIASEKVVTSEEHAEANVNTDWAGLLDKSPPPTALRNFLSDAARTLAPDELVHYAGGRLIALDTLLSAAECERLMAASESVGYGVTNYNQEYRGNLRMISTDDGMAAAVFERIKPFVPDRLDGVDMAGEPCSWRLSGLNECWRWAKYRPSDRFGAHCDANFVRTDNEVSLFTLNIYLNAVPSSAGGATRFYPASQKRSGVDEHGGTVDLAFAPAAGAAVLFLQPPQAYLLHDGERLVGDGARKYLLRSDVMYTREGERRIPGPSDADYVPDPDGK